MAAFSLATFDDVKAVQERLTALGYLDPPADGGYGPVSRWALGALCERAGVRFGGGVTEAVSDALRDAEPLPLLPGGDFAGAIIKAMLASGHWVARHHDCVNIAYVEGCNPDGTPNDNRNNVFNDVRTLVQVGKDGVPRVAGKWDATTEPSRKWTLAPMNPGGAFHIKFGQYKAWSLGTHHTHEAWVQTGEVEGFRDKHKTFRRDERYPVHGSGFGVNQHWGYDLDHDDMGNSSAGCLVGRSTAGHRQFMALTKADARFRASPAYRVMTAVMPAAALLT